MRPLPENLGGCGYCTHYQSKTNRCAHPAAGVIPIPIAAARDGGGRPARKGGFTLGGHCGPGSAHWTPAVDGAA